MTGPTSATARSPNGSRRWRLLAAAIATAAGLGAALSVWAARADDVSPPPAARDAAP